MSLFHIPLGQQWNRRSQRTVVTWVVGHLLQWHQCWVVAKPLYRYIKEWGCVLRVKQKGFTCHQNQGGDEKLSWQLCSTEGEVSKNGHIAAPHKPSMFLCSMFQEVYHKASAKAQIQLQFSTYLGGPRMWIYAESPGCHGWAVSLQWRHRGTVLLAMSATHAEKNRMGVREGVMEWDRG